MQRSHETGIGDAVPTIYLFVIALTLNQNDRLPASSLIAQINSSDFLFNSLAQICITGNSGPAGCGDLHHRQPLPVPGMFRQQLLNCQQPLDDSLGIVQPVDTYGNSLCMYSEFREQCATFI